jgi:hypothetical protein
MTGSCTSVDYGDQFDVMGSGNGPTHFNAVQKELLGWLDYGASPPITEVTASGTYTIDPYESVGTAPKALRIKTAANDWLYVEYRRPIGFDSYLSTNASVMNGVLVHLFDNSPNKIYLLDTTPATPSRGDAALTVGSIFEDTLGRVSITPISSNGTTMMVDVGVTGTPCTRAAPTVTLSPAQQEGPAGSTVTYAVTVRNNGSGCGASSFSLAVGMPTGWVASLTTPVLTLAEGATGTANVHVTSAAGAYALSVSRRKARTPHRRRRRTRSRHRPIPAAAPATEARAASPTTSSARTPARSTTAGPSGPAASRSCRARRATTS